MEMKSTKPILAYILGAIGMAVVAVFALPYYKSSYVPAAQISFPNSKSDFNVPVAFDISPDDRFIACVNTRRKLKVWTLPGVRLTSTYTLPRYEGEDSLSCLAGCRDIAVISGIYLQTCAGILTHSRHRVLQRQINFGPTKKSPRQFVISPSGTLVAEQYLNGTLKLWNSQTNLAVSLPRPDGLPSLSRCTLSGIGFSPDSSTLAAVYRPTSDEQNPSPGPAECRTFDTLTGKAKYTWKWNPPCGFVDGINGVKVAVSDGGNLVAVATNVNSPDNSDGAVVWEAATGRKRCSLDIEAPWTQISFIPGSTCVASADPGQITIWNYRTGAYMHSLHDPGLTQSFIVSRDGRYIASMYLNPGESTEAIDLWDIKSIT
jgi:WD40 repeat protein